MSHGHNCPCATCADEEDLRIQDEEDAAEVGYRISLSGVALGEFMGELTGERLTYYAAGGHIGPVMVDEFRDWIDQKIRDYASDTGLSLYEAANRLEAVYKEDK